MCVDINGVVIEARTGVDEHVFAVVLAGAQ